ncbi:MAG TPA: hypothetical protein QGG47_08975 [Acidobacteriota bacterium]|nr:hypothetical protein [Acidobacteriota bacterium]
MSGRLGAALIATLLLGSGCGSEPAGQSAVSAERAAGAAAEDPRQLFWRQYREATAARTSGADTAAIAAYRQALSLDPEHGDSLHFLAQLLYRQLDVTGAREHLEILTRIEPRVPRAWQQLSSVYGEPAIGWLADPRAASDAIGVAVANNPTNSGARVLEARWAAYSGNNEAAAAALSAALGQHSADLDAHLLRVWLAHRAGDEQQLAAALQRAVSATCRAAECEVGALLLLAAAVGAELPTGPAQGASGALPTLRSEATTRTITSKARYSPSKAPIAEAGLVAEIDLDGDGATDLKVWAAAPDAPARLAVASEEQEVELPGGAVAQGWGTATAAAGGRANPWRAVFVRTAAGVELLVVGGGGRPLRRFAARAGDWVQVDLGGLEEPLGSVLAAGDVDADGLDDLLLGNLTLSTQSDSRTVVGARLYRGTVSGTYERTDLQVATWLTAALLADVDGDSDVDLLVAHRVDPDRAAAWHLSPQTARPTVELWRNDGGRLQPDLDALPSIGASVLDVATLRRAEGGVDIYLATGSLRPERPEPDRYWRFELGNWVDATPVLGSRRFASTVRIAAGLESRSIVLLRGGLVPGDPRLAVEVTIPQ